MNLHVLVYSPAELTCEQLACGENARCVTDPRTGEPSCQCDSGYRGDGTLCEPSRLGEWLLHDPTRMLATVHLAADGRAYLFVLDCYAKSVLVFILTNMALLWHVTGRDSCILNSSFQHLQEEHAYRYSCTSYPPRNVNQPTLH